MIMNIILKIEGSIIRCCWHGLYLYPLATNTIANLTWSDRSNQKQIPRHRGDTQSRHAVILMKSIIFCVCYFRENNKIAVEFKSTRSGTIRRTHTFFIHKKKKLPAWICAFRDFSCSLVLFHLSCHGCAYCWSKSARFTLHVVLFVPLY